MTKQKQQPVTTMRQFHSCSVCRRGGPFLTWGMDGKRYCLHCLREQPARVREGKPMAALTKGKGA